MNEVYRVLDQLACTEHKLRKNGRKKQADEVSKKIDRIVKRMPPVQTHERVYVDD